MRTLSASILLSICFLLSSLASQTDKHTIRIKKTSFSIISGFNSFKINYKGEIKVSDDDTFIESISPGGFLQIEKATFGNKRKLLIESGSNGELNYKYNEGFKQKDFDPHGKEWLAEILLDVVRQTGIDAKGRATRFYNRGGIDEVINEMHIISSSYVNRKYFDALFQMNLKDAEITKSIESIPDVLSSNYETAELLISNRKILLQNETMQIAFLHAVKELSSSYETKRVLQASRNFLLLDKESISNEYFETINEMSSNYEKAEVITNLLKKRELNSAIAYHLFNSMESFSSNYEIKRVMNSIPPMELSDQRTIHSFFAATGNLSSNYELKKVLTYALSTHHFSNEAFLAFIRSLNEFSSNYELSETMKHAIPFLPESEEVREKFIAATEHFTSNMELNSVLTSYIKQINLNKSDFVNILKACEHFSSNYELAKILKRLVDQLPENEPEIYNAFLNSLEKISSDSEYRKIMNKLLKRKTEIKQ